MHEVVYDGGPTEWLVRTGTDSICALDNYVAAFRPRENLQLYQALAVASGHVNSRRAESRLRRWECDAQTSGDLARLGTVAQCRTARRHATRQRRNARCGT